MCEVSSGSVLDSKVDLLKQEQVQLIFFTLDFPGTDFWIGLKLKEASQCANETCNNATVWMETELGSEENFTFQPFMTGGVLTSATTNCIYAESNQRLMSRWKYQFSCDH